jgi:hypothetical protein
MPGCTMCIDTESVRTPSSCRCSQCKLIASCCCSWLAPHPLQQHASDSKHSVLLQRCCFGRAATHATFPPACATPRKNRCTTSPVRSLMAAAAVATTPHEMVMLPYHQRAPSCIVRNVEGTWATPYPR